MPSSHLILCHPLLLPPSIFSSIRVFSNESVLHIRWPKNWGFSFSISPSNEYAGLDFFTVDWLEFHIRTRQRDSAFWTLERLQTVRDQVPQGLEEWRRPKPWGLSERRAVGAQAFLSSERGCPLCSHGAAQAQKARDGPLAQTRYGISRPSSLCSLKLWASGIKGNRYKSCQAGGFSFG